MKVFFTISAFFCFIATLPLPIFYYTFLRIIVFLAAGIVVYYFVRQRELKWSIIFGIILILFNPILPIHFYLKSVWIPIDIATGILFLLLVFIKNKTKELPEEIIPDNLTSTKTLSRDRIIKTSLNKNNNNNNE